MKKSVDLMFKPQPFDQKYIGKIIMLPKEGPWSELNLHLVAAYDYVGEFFLSRKVSSGGWWDPLYRRVDNIQDRDIYTVNDAVCLVYEEIKKEEKAISDLSLDDKLVVNFEKLKQNNLNEFRDLAMRYWNTYSQCGILKKLANNVTRATEEHYASEYDRELRKIEKGLRRLNKRLNFYFGENAKEVEELIKSCDYFEDPGYYIWHMEGRIKDLQSQIKALYEIKK